VDDDGKLTATSADIRGSVRASYLEAKTGGNIAGWTINEDSLTGGNMTLGANGSITSKAFTVSTDGLLSATGAVLDDLTVNDLTVYNSFIVNAGTSSRMAGEGGIGAGGDGNSGAALATINGNTKITGTTNIGGNTDIGGDINITG